MANPNPKTEQLTPWTTETVNQQSKEQQIEGGKASGKVRRKKRDERQNAIAMFKAFGKMVADEEPNKEHALLIRKYGYIWFEVFKIINNPDASDTDKLKAICVWLDRVEGKPIQKQDIIVNDKSETNLQDILEQMRNTKVDDTNTNNNATPTT